MYSANEDPSSFASSEYEQQRYATIRGLLYIRQHHDEHALEFDLAASPRRDLDGVSRS